VLVYGPPGAGATTLVSSWLHHRRQAPYGWVSLDAGDNDPRRFWLHFAGSLRHLDPQFGRTGLASLEREPASYEHLSLLLHDLHNLTYPAVIVLDDVDVLTAPAVVEALGYLVRHLATGVRLVATAQTRTGPGPARLRSVGTLTEVGPEQLTFTRDDVCALLSMLNADEAAMRNGERIAALTEGWAAGVMMFARTLAGQSAPGGLEPRLLAAEAAVADYLMTEVLDRQVPAVREFLLATSVLDTPTADLCRRIALRPDAGAMLRALAARHQFVTSAGPGEYRYHRLFRKALLGRLADRDARNLSTLRARLAACLAADGDFTGAIASYAAAGHHDDALAVAVWRAIDLLHYREYGPPPLDMPGPLPVKYLDASPYRCYAIAACLVASRNADEAGRWLPRFAGLPERASALGALVAGLRGHTSAVLAAARAVGSGQTDWDGEAGLPWLAALDSSLTASLYSVRVRACLDDGDLDGALGCASGILLSSQGVLNAVVNPGVLARVAFTQGDLYRAQLLADGALAEAERFGKLDRAALLDALAVRGALLHERNDLIAADRVLREGMALARLSHAELTAIRCEMELARVLFARGLVPEALDRLAGLDARMRDLPAPEFLRTCRLAYEAAMRIAVGQVTWARARVEQLPAAVAAPLLIRLDLLAGDLPAAAARVARLDPVTRWQRIERHLLRAQVTVRGRSGALEHLSRAVEEARTDGFVRVFVDRGLDAHRLMRALNAKSPDDYVRRLVAAAEAEPARLAPVPQSPDPEPLTRREGQVLRYLATSLPYAQIAAEMFISRNTLKKHVQHIYRKLGVTNRERAVAAGRWRGLL
jgi:LuxR family transcriptional regulator, maltose regulon positive regulatory protein